MRDTLWDIGDIRGYVISMVKLSEDNKAAIVNSLKRGYGVQDLADKYGVTRKTIQRIKLNIPKAREVASTPMDLDTPETDPEMAIAGALETVDPGKILSEVDKNLNGIHAVMNQIANDSAYLVEDRARCAKVAVDANAKKLAVAAMVAGTGAIASADGEKTELAMIEKIVEGKD